MSYERHLSLCLKMLDMRLAMAVSLDHDRQKRHSPIQIALCIQPGHIVPFGIASGG